MSAEAQICIGTRSTTPSIPPVGKVCLWVRDSDGHVMQIDSSGTVLDITAMGATQLGGLSNVDINNPQLDEVLIFDGTNFVNSPLPVSTVAQIVTSGNQIATHTSGDGTIVSVFETVTSLALAGDNLVYTREGGTPNTIDLSGYDQSSDVATNSSAISSIQAEQLVQDADILSNTTATNNHINDTANPHSTTITQTIAADSGTDITTAQLEALSDGSNANTLHTHSEIISADTLSTVTAANNSVSIDVADEPAVSIVSPARHISLPFGGQQVKNMGDPTDPQDATTKNYVDNLTFSRAQESTSALMSQAAGAYVPHQTLTVTVPEAGDYLIEVSFIFSINTTTSDFISRINLNGTFSNELSIENKDSAGVGITIPVSGGGTANSGTNQRIPGQVATLATLAAGTTNVSFEFGGEVANQESSVYQSLIKITRTNV